MPTLLDSLSCDRVDPETLKKKFYSDIDPGVCVQATVGSETAKTTLPVESTWATVTVKATWAAVK